MALLFLLAVACEVDLPSPFASEAPAQLPLQFEIPDGYRGHVVLQYALGSCPVLPRRDGYTVIRFGDDGRACTSESTVQTTPEDRAYYVSPSGAHTDEDIILAVDFEHRQEATKRIFGTVFAVVLDPFVIQAIDRCRWEDTGCWEGLRSR
ncbi:MAG TPA: hypothetical protein VMQ78_05810 [Candidatus Limnocylindria bacterium]|nr:hypothetical protein [Candidatus Limnocylindria bacterium]